MIKALSITCLIFLIGCATWPMGIEQNRQNLMKLELGMGKADVVKIMGNPYDREVHQLPDGSGLEFLIYLTRYTDSGAISDSDKTPICFNNGKVTGWGWDSYMSEKQKYNLRSDVHLANVQSAPTQGVDQTAYGLMAVGRVLNNYGQQRQESQRQYQQSVERTIEQQRQNSRSLDTDCQEVLGHWNCKTKQNPF